MLRSRSASLSRPGSRCSRPRSRTYSKSQSTISRSNRKTRSSSTATVDGKVHKKQESVPPNGNGKTNHQSWTAADNGGKSHGKLELTVPADRTRTGSRQNSSEGEIQDLNIVSEGESVGIMADLDCSGEALGDAIEEEAKTGSVKDHIRPRTTSSLQATEDRIVGKTRTSKSSARGRRSGSLDRSTPRKEAR